MTSDWFRDAINRMNRIERLRWYAAAKYVTVGEISQVVDDQIKVFYVAKVHGVIISDEGGYRHETREAAREHGKKILSRWKEEYARLGDDESVGSWYTAQSVKEAE